MYHAIKTKSRYCDGHSSECRTCIDLFCGAGGLTLGFAQAGGKPLAAVDNDTDSIKTYRKMFPICEEIYSGQIEDWSPKVSNSKIDVIIGGPPCQGFSPARGLRFIEDPRNHLYKQFVRLVNLFRPSWLVMENVPGITSIGKSVILKQIFEDFAGIGYWLDYKIINMANYGVPQIRRRAIFVGSRVASSFNWPRQTHGKREHITSRLIDVLEPYVSVGDALSDLPWPLGQYIAHRANSQMRGPRNRDLWSQPAFTMRVRGDEFGIVNTLAQGTFAADIPEEIELTYRPISNEYQGRVREMSPPWLMASYSTPQVIDSPSKTLVRPRRLAVREQARLQSFPDWFEFAGTPYSQGRQIGNAVPPLFAKLLFLSIFDALND